MGGSAHAEAPVAEPKVLSYQRYSVCRAGMPIAYARLGVNNKRTYAEDGARSGDVRHHDGARCINSTRRRAASGLQLSAIASANEAKLRARHPNGPGGAQSVIDSARD